MLLKPLSRLGIDERVKHEARVLGEIVHDPIEMLARSHHWPKVAADCGALELRQRSLGNHFKCFASGIRNEVKIEPVHTIRFRRARALWKDTGISDGTERKRSSGANIPGDARKISRGLLDTWVALHTG